MSDKYCAACGHEARPKDRLLMTNGGKRIHESHFKDPKSGYFGKKS